AEALGIVESIRRAKPTDGLFGDDRSDEDQLGASYPELEWAMALRERGEAGDRDALSPRQREVLAIYDKRHAANAHKWMPVPVCTLPASLRER
ncbi:MAG: NAD(+) synthase, partial [Bacteroidetes bacterium]|nr:NAD(+) synthase [Bacteroidota bacterium]